MVLPFIIRFLIMIISLILSSPHVSCDDWWRILMHRCSRGRCCFGVSRSCVSCGRGHWCPWHCCSNLSRPVVSLNEGGSISFQPLNLRYLDNFTCLSASRWQQPFSKTLPLGLTSWRAEDERWNFRNMKYLRHLRWPARIVSVIICNILGITNLMCSGQRWK